MEIFKLFGTIDINGNTAIKTLDTVDRAVDQTHKHFISLSDTLKNAISFGLGIAGFQGLSAAIKGSAGAGLALNSQLEQNEVAFRVLTGSADQARQTIKDLYNYAATTPFEFPNVVEAGRALQVVGLNVKETIKWVGDLAAANPQATIEEVARAIARLKSGDFGEAFERLRDFGISRQMLQGEGLVFDKGGSYQGSVDQALKAVQNIVNKRYKDMAGEQSKTFAGMLSTFKDNVASVFGTLMEPAFNNIKQKMPQMLDLLSKFSDTLKNQGFTAALKVVIPEDTVNQLIDFGNKIKDIFNFITSHAEEVKASFIGIGAGIATLKVITTVNQQVNAFVAGMNLLPNATSFVSRLGTAFMELRTAPTILQGISGAFSAIFGVNPMVLAIVAAVAALAAAAYLIYTNWSTISEFFVNLWTSVSTTVSSFIDSISASISNWWSGVVASFQNGVNSVTTTLSNWGNEIQLAVSSALNWLVNLIPNTWNSIVNFTQQAWDTIKNAVVIAFEWMYNHNYYFQAIVDAIRNAWNIISNTTKEVWQFIVNSLTNVWNTIVSIAKAIWAPIADYFTTTFNTIKNSLINTWSSIVGVLTQIWNTIKSVCTTAWNAVYGVIAGVVNSVKQYIISGWNTVVAVTSSIWSSVVGVFNNVKASVINVLSNLANEALQWGRNLVNNFVQGILNMADSVKQAAISVMQGVVRILGFHSPAEEGPGADADKWAPNLMKMYAEGIRQGSAMVSDAASQVVQELKDKLTELTKEYANQSNVVANAEAEYRKLIATKGELAKETQDAADKYKTETKSLNDLANQIVDTQLKLQQQSWLTDQVRARLEILDAEQERSLALLGDDANKIDELNVKNDYLNQKFVVQAVLIANLQREYDAALQIKGQDAEETRNAYLELVKAQTEEAKLANEIRNTNKEIAQQRDEFEQTYSNLSSKVSDAVKKYNDELVKAKEDYENKVEQINNRLIQDEQRVTESYYNELEKRTKQLTDFVGLFDAIQPKNVTGEQLLENLRSQVETFRQWQENLAVLSARGVDQGLVSALRDMGPKAAAEIAALNTLSDEQLSQYVALWQQKNADAHAEAVSELEGLRNDVDAQIQALRAQASIQLSQYETEWQQKNAEIRENTVKELQQIVQEAAKQGQEMVLALANAIRNASPELANALQSLPQFNANQLIGSDQVQNAQQQKEGVISESTAQAQGVIAQNDVMKQSVIQTWADISANISTKQTEISTLLNTSWNLIQQQLNALWLKIKTDEFTTWNAIRSHLFEVADTVQKRFENLVLSAQTWGINLMSNFIAGIMSQFSRLMDTLQAMTEIVDSYMPHSPAKRGPLSRLGEYGPSFVKTFAEGIVNSLPSLELSVDKMAAVASGAKVTNNYATSGDKIMYVTIQGSNTDEIWSQFERQLVLMGFNK